MFYCLIGYSIKSKSIIKSNIIEDRGSFHRNHNLTTETKREKKSEALKDNIISICTL